jgi:hypothetical protein
MIRTGATDERRQTPRDVQVSPRWSVPTLVAFRVGTCYFGAFGLVLIIGLVPVLLTGVGVDPPVWAMRGLIHGVRPPVEWVGTHVLGLHVETSQVGSDSAFQWSALYCLAVLSLAAALVWSVLDGRQRHDRLHTWVWSMLRLLLAAAMFYFGMAKVIPTQMPFVLNRLVEPYGSFSPTGALWAQVGISQPYQMMLGAAEVLGGLLLLLPRTAAAGALVCAFDLSQVFVLNMTYDIRLKSVSSQLLLLSLFLLAPHARRLFAVVFTGRAVPAHTSSPLFAGRRANRVALVVGVCAGLVLLAAFGGQGWRQFTRPTPHLYGIWQVDGFSAEGYRRDPLLTDELRWRRIIFDRPFLMSDPVMVTVQHMDDSFRVFGGTIDAATHFIDLGNEVELGSYEETPTKIRLTYWWPGPGTDRIVIDGEDFAGHRIHAWFTRLDPTSFPLVERGFNWIQEQPYNR